MLSTTSAWKLTIARLWAKSQTIAEWRLPFALFICGLIAYAAAYTWHMLSTFDIVNLIRDVNYDDSFYYFQIAYNLAQGKFSTFDGGITQTNGYHPVWMLLITPFYWIFDKEAALFGIKAFEIMLVAGGVALIALAARLARLAWLLLFAALPMLYRNPHELLYGLEAAAALFALALLILAVCLYMRDPQRWKWHLAALAFALPWVRIEYIAISLAVTAALCVIEWSRLERRSLRLSALANIRHAYIPLIGAVLGMLIYFAYNRLIFGGVLPVSAVTRQAWSQDLWKQNGGYDFMQSLWGALQIDAFDYEILIALEICAYLLLVWRLALRSKERRDWLLLAFLVGVFGLAAGHLAKFAQTVLIMHPYHADKIWYFVPAYLMTALIIPIRLYVAIWFIRRFLAPRWRITANALSIGVFAIGAAVLLGNVDFAQPFRWVDEKSELLYREPQIASYMGTQVMNRALPEEGSVIGSWDAGVVGYFSRFPVVNLDGFMNSYDYFHAQRIRRIEGVNFFRVYGVTHFANNRSFYELPNIPEIVFEDAPFPGRADKGRFALWTYAIPLGTPGKINYSQWVWNNIQPHFDYLSNGIGVVLDGRAARALAQSCAPDDPMVWTWQEYGKTVIRVEPSLYQSRSSMCVDARILPISARQPAQAEIMTTLSAYFANLIRSSKLAIRADFDVYISDGNLIYGKSQCGEVDVDGRFFANIFPVDVDDLPAILRQRGYETIDFNFTDYGIIGADGKCWAAVSRPNYPIAEIHAGQYVESEDGYAYIWEGAYRLLE